MLRMCALEGRGEDEHSSPPRGCAPVASEAKKTLKKKSTLQDWIDQKQVNRCG